MGGRSRKPASAGLSMLLHIPGQGGCSSLSCTHTKYALTFYFSQVFVPTLEALYETVNPYYNGDRILI